MLCISGTWFFCTFVAAFALSDSIAQDSISDSSTAESVQEVTSDRAADLGALLDHGYGSMVALVAGDTRLVAHRAVLSARSPVFQRILQDVTVGEVATPGVEGPVLRQLVAYLYTLQAPQLPALAAQLLAAADQYGLPALKADCERQVLARLSVETAAAAAVVAVRHSSDSLRKAAVDYIRDHIFRVMATQGWADARNSQPQAMAEVDRLLSESASETGTPAPAASRTAPTAEPQSVHSGRGQTPASAVSPTSSDSSASTGSTDICLLCSSAPAESGSSPQHATQPHSDYSGHQTPTTAATTVVAETITNPDDDNISLLRQLSAEEKNRRLMEAAKWGAVGELEALLAAGADVAARDSELFNRTALHWAAVRGHEEAARRLLAAGAAVDARDSEWGKTPLHEAARKGYAAVVRLLLAAESTVDARDSDQETPLHEAARNGHSDVVRLLLAAESTVDARDSDQETPLHEAASSGHAAVVRLLLAAGADHGATTVNGRTPLHYAAFGGHTEVAVALLAAGADRAARDWWGDTPLDDARRRGHQEVEQLLLQGRQRRGVPPTR